MIHRAQGGNGDHGLGFTARTEIERSFDLLRGAGVPPTSGSPEWGVKTGTSILATGSGERIWTRRSSADAVVQVAASSSPAMTRRKRGPMRLGLMLSCSLHVVANPQYSIPRGWSDPGEARD